MELNVLQKNTEMFAVNFLIVCGATENNLFLVRLPIQSFTQKKLVPISIKISIRLLKSGVKDCKRSGLFF